ncbi:MAG: NADH-quinone oxidoreductase subunit NuoE [Thermacetogeniaceae bacterium]
MDLLEVKGIIACHPEPEGRLLGILEAIQRKFRYLPEDVLRVVAEELKVPLSRVFGVATFYSAFSLEPKGRHLISVCHGTACHVRGAGQLTERLEKELGIKEGETTDDGLFTLEAVRCLGCCSLSPVVSIDGTTYGRVKTEQIPEILARWKGGKGDGELDES